MPPLILATKAGLAGSICDKDGESFVCKMWKCPLQLNHRKQVYERKGEQK